MPSETNASATRRLIAFGLDWIVIACYMAALFAGTVFLTGSVPRLTAPYNALHQELVGFLSLTLPVVVYFAIGEYFFRGSLGKRLMKLRVISGTREGLRLWQVLVRNALKFLPWEMAHYAIHQFISAQVENRAPGADASVALVGAYLLAGVYVAALLWSKNHRTPYDLSAGTSVVQE
jgi:uncharacterized RDD family membrane protein YckC